MKPPSGRQLQVWFKNDALKSIEAKAEELNRSVAWVIRQSVGLTLNNPNIVWVDGSPILNPQNKIDELRALIESKEVMIRELQTKLKDSKCQPTRQ